jgi:adenosylcobinamide kinase / adenosylcobinamide-phosphate guanylyltransferase
MDALLIGTGDTHGWPQDGCACASCMRARAAGVSRAPARVVVDGELTIVPGTQPVSRQGGRIARHQVRAVPGGWDITGPDATRLLAAAGPGAVPEPPDGTSPFDLALLDLLSSPAQLGRLRARGLLHPGSTVAVLFANHRIGSEAELARRCGLWGVIAGHDGQLLTIPAASPGPGGRARPHRTLILGGARSGKSREAELRLSGEPAVTYLAAGPWAADSSPADPGPADPGPADPGTGDSGTADSGTGDSWTGVDGAPDTEWADRIAAHRAARPPWWRTEESLDVAGALRAETGAILIDGIGTWLAATMEQCGAWAGRANSEQLLAARIDDLIDAWRQTTALVVAVTDQVGSGLVPLYPAGRNFRDQLGWLNQRLAAESDECVLVVAGRVMTLPT